VTHGVAPIARPLAQAAMARDAERLRAHEDTARYGWVVDFDSDILVTVRLQARAAGYEPGRSDCYVIAMEGDCYDLWPPETKFVNAKTGTYTPGTDAASIPRTDGLPGFAIHPSFSGFVQAGRVDQLVCFSFTRGYYDSNHSPLPHERWRQGRHWLYSTVRVLHRALQPPYYQGRAT
jgi:hypothetical protein